MRFTGWRAAVLSAACYLPGCGGGGSVAADAFDSRCYDIAWGSFIRGSVAPSIAVGATATVELYTGGFDSLTELCVSRFLASVVWRASVPGVASIRPGTRPEQAIVTGESVGETRLEAQLTFTDGSTKGTTANETLRVVPR